MIKSPKYFLAYIFCILGATPARGEQRDDALRKTVLSWPLGLSIGLGRKIIRLLINQANKYAGKKEIASRAVQAAPEIPSARLADLLRAEGVMKMESLNSVNQ